MKSLRIQRLIALLLIVLLPIEAAWAMAGRVCMPATGTHEADITISTHHEGFAHETHVPGAMGDASDCSGDTHCLTCHLGCCAPVAKISSPSGIAKRLPHAVRATAFLDTSPHERPERPKWPRLA
ncbi:MAG: hypothetical protein L6Q60_13815 [Rhodocyclaceae bacterium]|nr:hypothetical protein [Rhodocyclaceae bacterium]